MIYQVLEIKKHRISSKKVVDLKTASKLLNIPKKRIIFMKELEPNEIDKVPEIIKNVEFRTPVKKSFLQKILKRG